MSRMESILPPALGPWGSDGGITQHSSKPAEPGSQRWIFRLAQPCARIISRGGCVRSFALIKLRHFDLGCNVMEVRRAGQQCLLLQVVGRPATMQLEHLIAAGFVA